MTPEETADAATTEVETAAVEEETTDVGDTAPSALDIFVYSLAQQGGPARTYIEGDYRIVVNGDGELISCIRR